MRFSIDTVRYRDNLNRFMVELNADGAQLLKEEMNLLLRDILRFTPPRSRKQGTDLIRKDMRNVAIPLNPNNIKFPELAKAIRKRDVITTARLLPLLGKFFSIGFRLISAADLKASHLKMRNQYGRVRGRALQVANVTDWRKYLRDVQSRVGYARAGWAPAARAVGLNVPSWVDRHSSYSKGSYMPPTPDDLTVEAINRSVKIPNYERRIVYPAINARAKSLSRELARLLAGGKSRRASLAGTPTGAPSA